MGSQFLKSFAFGMNDEIQTLGQLALNSAMQFPTSGETQQQPQQPPPQQPAMAAPPMTATPPPNMPMPNMEPPAGPPPTLAEPASAATKIDFIKANTTGEASSYDTLFGNAEQEGGPFAGVKLTDMTLGEVKQFTDPRGPYAKWVKSQVGRIATPTGRFQVVGSTLDAAASDLQLPDDTPYTPEVQDRIAEWIYDKQGPNAWEAWGSGGGGGGVTASARNFPTGGGTEPSVDVSELEEDLPDMSEKAQRRRRWGSLLSGLGTGLGQMSHGKTVDLSEVMEDYLDRQKAMRDRLMEITQEKRRQTERKEDVALGIEGDYRRGEIAETAAVRGETRREAADVRAEGREEERAARERERLAAVARTSIPLIYPDVDADVAGSVADIDGPLAMQWAEARQTEADTQADLDKTHAEREPIRAMMEAAGYPEIGLLALDDPDKAFTQFEKLTGTTGNMKDALVLMDRTSPEAQALSYRLKLEAGTVDKRMEAAATSQDKLLTEAETRVNDYRTFDRQLQMATELTRLDDTGFMDKVMLMPNKFFADLGINREEATQDTIFDAIAKRSTAGVLAAENKGAASDRDTIFFEQSLPSLGNTPEANDTISYVNRELARRERVYVDAWREHYISSDQWMDSEDRYAHIQEKLEAAGATGDVIPRVASIDAAVNLPAGTPFIMIGDDGSQVLGIAD